MNNIWADLWAGNLDILLYILIGIGVLVACFAIYLGIRLAVAKGDGQQTKARGQIRNSLVTMVILLITAPTLLMVGCTPADPYEYTLHQDTFTVGDVGNKGVQLIEYLDKQISCFLWQVAMKHFYLYNE